MVKAVSSSPATILPTSPIEPGGSAVPTAVAEPHPVPSLEPLPPLKELDSSGIASVFPIKQLETLPYSSEASAIFRLDNGFLDALRLEARRFETADGVAGHQLDFVIGGPSRPAMDLRFTKAGASAVTFEFFGRTRCEKDGHSVLKEGAQKLPIAGQYYSHAQPGTKPNPNLALRLQGLGWEVDYMPHDGPSALRGHMRIRLFGSDEDCRKGLEWVIKTLGLQPAFSPPTPQSIRRYALMRLLWRTDPQKAKEILGEGDLSGLKVKDLEQALLALGVEQARIDGLRYQQVAPGHFTVMDDKTVGEMKAAGFRYAYSTVASVEHLHSILTHGQKSTKARWSEGILFSGMSSMADLGSGGALGVFSRLVTDTANGKSWMGRTYKLILKPELLARTDIWGWPGDYYGRSWDLGPKNFGAKLVEDIKAGGGFRDTNEIICPVENGPEWIARVVAQNESARAQAIEHLKKQGYSPPDGMSLEDFVVCSPTINADLLG